VELDDGEGSRVLQFGVARLQKISPNTTRFFPKDPKKIQKNEKSKIIWNKLE
jgi:hypothetical protein